MLAVLTPGVTALAAPMAAGAQRTIPLVTLDIGATVVDYTTIAGEPPVQQTSATIGPALHLATRLLSFDAGATWAQPADGGWSAQGGIAGTAFTPAVGVFRGEVNAAATGSAHQDETRTARLLGGVRLHAMRSSYGGWIGGAGGRVWDGAVWRATAAGDVGAWASRGTLSGLVTVAPTAVATGPDDDVRYTDIESSIAWSLGRFELGGSAGGRVGRSGPSVVTAGDRTVWASASVTAWVMREVAVVAAGGTYPVDFTQSFPGGRFAMLGVRLAVGSRRVGPAAAEALASGASAPAAVGPALVVGPATGDDPVRTIRVEAPGATRVEITGDPTGWAAAALTRVGNRWAITLALRPGVHQITIRVDGGPWRVPAGLGMARDEFGGEAGLLVVDR